MNNECTSSAGSTPAQDHATEALLREYGRLQSHDDEDFLAAFEQRLAKEAEPETAPTMVRLATSSSAKNLMRRRIFQLATFAAVACALVTTAWYLDRSPKNAEAVEVAPNLPAVPDAKAKHNPSAAPTPPKPLAAKNERTPPNAAAPATLKPSVEVLSPIVVANPPNLVVSAPTSNAMSSLPGVDLKSELGLVSAGSEILDGKAFPPNTVLQMPDATFDYQPPIGSSLEQGTGGFALMGTLNADGNGPPKSRLLADADPASAAGPPSGAVCFQPGASFGVFGGAILLPSTTRQFSDGLTITGGVGHFPGQSTSSALAGTISGTIPARSGSMSDEMLGYDVKDLNGTRAGGPDNAVRYFAEDAPITYDSRLETASKPLALTSLPPPPPVQLQGLGYVTSKGSNYSGYITLNGGTLVDVSAATTFNNGGSTTATSTIAGAGRITKHGDGSFVLSGRRDDANDDTSFGDKTATPVPGLQFTTPPDIATPGNRYDAAPVNPFLAVLSHPLSTFSIDVDTASYSNIRRLIQSGAGVPPAAVRLEEVINYFPYSYIEPTGEHPIAVKVESAACPWAPSHRLVKIALKAKEIDRSRRAAANLVFLVDVSGSMSSEDKLALVVKNLRVLTAALNADDTVSFVTYAGNSGIALEPTHGDKKQKILDTLASLNAGGSTNGAGGIMQAYELAKKQFIKEGVNRVVLCTDGDFNVGITGQQSLIDLVSERAQDGIFLTVCGYGQGNLNDSMLEAITNKGNGVYYYIDSEREGRKVFQDELFGTLVTVAKDVKLQVEFNPAHAAQYRLIGYDNRMLAKEDFANDRVDAGDMGAGHRVTALYEVIPTSVAGANAIPLKYQANEPAPDPAKPASPEMLTVKLRYKEPVEKTSKLLELPFTEDAKAKASTDFAFAATVAEFGNWLRGERAEGRSLAQLIEAAEAARGDDPHGYRGEFIELMKRVK